MKSIILQEKLKNSLNVLGRIITKNQTLPILNNILLENEKNFLRLEATNLEIGIKWWILTKTEKEGKTVAPSQILSSFVSLLPNKKITLEFKNNNLLLECENYKTQIRTYNPEDFPIIPKVEKNDFIEIKSSVLTKGLMQVADIPVPSNTKPEISGIYFEVQKNLIILTGTDSFKLGEKKIYIKENNTSELKNPHTLIIPQKTAKEVINIFGEKDSLMRIYFSPNQIMFERDLEETKHPEVQLVSRLIEGEYPNYKEIIPKDCSTYIEVKKEEFLNQIKSASLFSGRTNEIKIKPLPKENKLEISSKDPEIGSYQSFIVGNIKGEPTDVSFNYRFLLDGLSNIKSSEVIFELNDDSGPGVLKPVGDDSYVYIVMPIKRT